MNYLQGTTEHEIYTVLAAGFCERWPKAWRDGFALVRGQLLIKEKTCR